MPDYLTAFDMENFELGSDQDQIGRMISLYFQDARSHAASLWLPTKNIENNPMQSSRRSPAGTLWANTWHVGQINGTPSSSHNPLNARGPAMARCSL